MPLIHEQRYRKDFIHHQTSRFLASIRDIVFGLEDGMVSTLGALTGIAIGSQNHFTIVLAGMVIIAVESISMAVGTYLSAKSVRNVEMRKLKEEKEEITQYPDEERQELAEMYIADGWPEELSQQMAETASKSPTLFLNEMAYRELNISPNNQENPMHNAIFMLFSYIGGGLLPVLPYFFFPIAIALPFSIIATLVGLFTLGSFATKFTNQIWWKAGLEMLALASLAAGIGYAIGFFSQYFL